MGDLSTGWGNAWGHARAADKGGARVALDVERCRHDQRPAVLGGYAGVGEPA